MKLDRNINGTGRGKYGLIKTRRLVELTAFSGQPDFKNGEASADDVDKMVSQDIKDAISTLEAAGIIEWGEPGTEGEFFVIKLRDEYANPALREYAWAVIERGGDRDYAKEVAELAYRAGTQSPFCKKPD